MIRSELIAIPVAENDTVHSDKLDFETFNERQARSIEPMKDECSGAKRNQGGVRTRN